MALGVPGPSSSGYGKLLAGLLKELGSRVARGTSGTDSCRIDEASLEGGFDRRAALAASKVPQSRSVLGSRGDSPGVRGEGDDGRDPGTEPGLEDEGELPVAESREASELILGVRGGEEVSRTADPGEGPRDEP